LPEVKGGSVLMVSAMLMLAGFESVIICNIEGKKRR
jgi:hypothetical protein